MKNFRSGDKGPKRRDFGDKRRDFSDNRGSRPDMHEAICSDCGHKCEVPFRPTGDRPVFCTSCFAKHSPSGSNRSDRSDRSDSRDRQRPSFGEKRMFEAVCAKCGKRCEVPFRPTGDKPVYCSQCFDKSGNAPAPKASDQLGKQFEILNSKLDRILKALNPVVSAPAAKLEKVAEPKKAKAKKIAAKPVAKKAKAKKRK